MFRILLPGTFQELLFALPANRWLLMASSPLRMYHQDLCHATRRYEGYAAKPASSMCAPRILFPSSTKAAQDTFVSKSIPRRFVDIGDGGGLSRTRYSQGRGCSSPTAGRSDR